MELQVREVQRRVLPRGKAHIEAQRVSSRVRKPMDRAGLVGLHSGDKDSWGMDSCHGSKQTHLAHSFAFDARVLMSGVFLLGLR